MYMTICTLYNVQYFTQRSISTREEKKQISRQDSFIYILQNMKTNLKKQAAIQCTTIRLLVFNPIQLFACFVSLERLSL